jgi:hypothetical protein
LVWEVVDGIGGIKGWVHECGYAKWKWIPYLGRYTKWNLNIGRWIGAGYWAKYDGFKSWLLVGGRDGPLYYYGFKYLSYLPLFLFFSFCSSSSSSSSTVLCCVDFLFDTYIHTYLPGSLFECSLHFYLEYHGQVWTFFLFMIFGKYKIYSTLGRAILMLVS